jgi:pimeloyl-ACP methyl ester carboxylesterase
MARQKHSRPAPSLSAQGESATSVQIRIHGEANQPTLIYLPGLHGDWTLVASFRAEATRFARFVECTYPQTTQWSLEDYAVAVTRTLLAQGIDRGWLLAESFGSQVAWALLACPSAPSQPTCRGRTFGLPGDEAVQSLKVDGLILAGGFVRHPWPMGVRCLEWLLEHMPDYGVRVGLWLYLAYARIRHRQAPETWAGLHEFVQRRRQPQDRRAVAHRLRLIRQSDPRPVAEATRLPVYALWGWIDPLVPNLWVARWLARSCPGYRGCRGIWWADHNVLATEPREAAVQIEQWLMQAQSLPRQHDHAASKASA